MIVIVAAVAALRMGGASKDVMMGQLQTTDNIDHRASGLAIVYGTIILWNHFLLLVVVEAALMVD